MGKKSVECLDAHGMRVFVRVDFNVPQDDEGNISDDTRIVAAIPTIEFLLKQKAKIILASHFGRPKGKVVDSFKMDSIARRLSDLLGVEVQKLDDCIGPKVEEAVASMKECDVILLENLRFHPEEEANDSEFSRKLACLADAYINDAFGTAHRAHASTEGIAHFIPGYAGLLMQKELQMLGDAIKSPKRPLVAIMGGAKVSDKIKVIENLLDLVDTLLIGGGMAFTFLAAQGHEIGKSLLDVESLDYVKEMILRAKSKGVKLIIPLDCVVADAFDNSANSKVVSVDNIPAEWMGLDIGPDTIELFVEEIKTAGSVIWNGPLGAFEMTKFECGTKAIAKAMSEASSAVTIIGGGDSAAAVMKFGLADRMTHISTGGGASLEFLEGRELPGVVILKDEVCGGNR